jgi:hypothetical protein
LPLSTVHDRCGSFSSDRPASDALDMSASLRSRPNLRTAAIRRGVPTATKAVIVRWQQNIFPGQSGLRLL